MQTAETCLKNLQKMSHSILSIKNNTLIEFSKGITFSQLLKIPSDIFYNYIKHTIKIFKKDTP